MKLASIERIVSLQSIEGADRIELAKVLGYDCVVKKGDFKVGDLCLWINPDTIVPNIDEFRFLEKENFRVKVRRFKGKYSRGLVIPLKVETFESTPIAFLPNNSFQFTIGEGLDVTDIVGVKKYEVPVPVQLAGQVKGTFPSFLKKTDEENLCKWPLLVNELNGKEVYITLKYDGTSTTFYLHEDVFGVCSRNMDLKETPESVYWKIAREYKIEEGLREIGLTNSAIQGEIYGPGIQSNRVGVDKIQLAVFNGFYTDQHQYMNYQSLTDLCKHLKLPMVQTIGRTVLDTTIDALQELADLQIYPTGKPAEGIVIRPVQEAYSERLNSRLSCKVISNKYAVKHGL